MRFMNLGYVVPTINARLIFILALGLSFFYFISISGLVYAQDFESELTGPMMNSENDNTDLQTSPETLSEYQNYDLSKMFVKNNFS